MKTFQSFLAEQAKPLVEVTVAVHKAFPGKVAQIHADLSKFHGHNGAPLRTSESGDHVHIHLPHAAHNNVEAVRQTLKTHGHEDHHAYHPNQVQEG